jgi:LAO/AO transport system kinase
VPEDSLTASLIGGLRAGDRRSLARAITLIESVRSADRTAANALLRELAPPMGRTLRLGVSGAPGVGKSTFIEAFGLHLIARGHRVAVLAIDPSSTLSGGSILGDKTRMERLSTQDAAFIRPTPSAGTLGGVADRTREALLLCESAGYDIVIIETVGIGQSEVAVAGMTDLLLLLQLPNAGDELQAMKRGVMELADIVIVNKADLDAGAARRAVLQIEGSMRRRGSALAVSAATGEGISELWSLIEGRVAEAVESGAFSRRRSAQPAVQPATARPFRILGVQQIAIGGVSKDRLRRLWVELLGLQVSGAFASVRENVDEDICELGGGVHRVEIDLMQPIDPEKKPAVHATPLNHIGFWVDDLPAAVEWLTAQGLRFAPGGIRKGAAGHDVCFIHPKASDEFPFAGEGVLIELVQAPTDVIAALT